MCSRNEDAETGSAANAGRQWRAPRSGASPLHAGVSCGEGPGSWAAAWERGRRAEEGSGSPVPWWVLEAWRRADVRNSESLRGKRP